PPLGTQLRSTIRNDLQSSKNFGDVDAAHGRGIIEAIGVPYGIRTRVTNVKGWCPRPLDERDSGAGAWVAEGPVRVKPSAGCRASDQGGVGDHEAWVDRAVPLLSTKKSGKVQRHAAGQQSVDEIALAG